MATRTFFDPVNRATTLVGAVTAPAGAAAYIDLWNPAGAPAAWGPPAGKGWAINAQQNLSGAGTNGSPAPGNWLLRPVGETGPNGCLTSWPITTSNQGFILRGTPSPDGVALPSGYYLYMDFAGTTSHYQLQRFSGTTFTSITAYLGYPISAVLPAEVVLLALVYNAVVGTGPTSIRIIVRDPSDPMGLTGVYNASTNPGGKVWLDTTLVDSSGSPASLATSGGWGLYGNTNGIVRGLRTDNITSINDFPAGVGDSLYANAPTVTPSQSGAVLSGLAAIKGIGSATHSWCQSNRILDGYGAPFSTAANPTVAGLTAGQQVYLRDQITDGAGAVLEVYVPVRAHPAPPRKFARAGDSLAALTPKSPQWQGNDPALPLNPKFVEYVLDLQRGGRAALIGAGGASGAMAQDFALPVPPTVSTNSIPAGTTNPVVQFASGSMAGLNVGSADAVLLGDELFLISAATTTTATLVGVTARVHNAGTVLAGAKGYLYHLLKTGVFSGIAMTGAPTGLLAFFAGEPTPWYMAIMYGANEMQLEPQSDPNGPYKNSLLSYATVLAGVGITPILDHPFGFNSYNGPVVPSQDGALGPAWPMTDTAMDWLYRACAAIDSLVGTTLNGVNGAVQIKAGMKHRLKLSANNSWMFEEGLHYNYPGAWAAADVHAQAFHDYDDPVATATATRAVIHRGRA